LMHPLHRTRSVEFHPQDQTASVQNRHAWSPPPPSNQIKLHEIELQAKCVCACGGGGGGTIANKLVLQIKERRYDKTNMKILYFFYICGSFFPSWIRIRIQQLKLMRIHADPDPSLDVCEIVECTL
jgi:hypothetical protein